VFRVHCGRSRTPKEGSTQHNRKQFLFSCRRRINDSLAAAKGNWEHVPGKSLLDETVIVASSEFGRTPNGGGWTDGGGAAIMNFFRNYADPEIRTPIIGFRCAKSVSTSP
jgi:hypothetical protein